MHLSLPAMAGISGAEGVIHLLRALEGRCSAETVRRRQQVAVLTNGGIKSFTPRSIRASSPRL